MSAKGWIELADRMGARCSRCGNRARNALGCPRCPTKVFCSERCFEQHYQRHAPEIAADAAAERKNEQEVRAIVELQKDVIVTACPKCDRNFVMPRESVGAEAPCPYCKKRFTVAVHEKTTTTWTTGATIVLVATLLIVCCGIPSCIAALAPPKQAGQADPPAAPNPPAVAAAPRSPADSATHAATAIAARKFSAQAVTRFDELPRSAAPGAHGNWTVSGSVIIKAASGLTRNTRWIVRVTPDGNGGWRELEAGLNLNP